MQRISKLIRWANLTVILLTFLSYLSPFINPEHCWPITFFGLAYPWLLLINFLLILFWLFQKDIYFLFSLACIIMGWNHCIGFIGWNTAEVSQTKEQIHIATYNVRGGGKFSRHITASEGIDSEFHRLINGQLPNTILCFQEWRSVQSGILADKGFNYYHNLRNYGTTIFSKTPFLDKGGEGFKKTANSYIWADVKINGQIVRIFNIHLQSNYVSGYTDKVIQDGDLQEKETWRDIRTVIKMIKRATNARSEQAEILAAAIAQSPHPVIVCGDFNDTPLSFTYQIVAKGLKDTFKEKGSGFGTTYAGLIPALRIDYILTDQRFKVMENSIPRINFSDHYPVVSRLEFSKK